MNNYNRKSMPEFSISKLTRSLHELEGNEECIAPNMYNPIFNSREQHIKVYKYCYLDR
jgi:hypothetical protein